ncbi:Metal tolerance protein 4 [Madurella mycetomatis]|uniref:Metal tolerance protein 4 n=1 Tax=Madurella mycetomatis TaxID=100816 RepID=A0A175WDX0_9PEZI|nr:Metal tolerance protein 4 [Madurella mycetomatis]
MSSPTGPRNTVPRGSFLLLQDEQPLTPKGHGALASLIRHHPTAALANPFGREGEEGVGEGPEDESTRREERRMSAILNSSHVRSMRLIGNSNPRYRWERYWRSEAELAAMPKHIRAYHERVNYLVQQYLYIDRLLDSSLPHDLLNEYNDMPISAFRGVEIPATITEGSALAREPPRKVKRTPKDIYCPTETTPLFSARCAVDDGDGDDDDLENGYPKPEIPWLEDDLVDSDAPIVTLAIYVNFIANAVLLAGKIAVVVSVPSISVLASLVDALLDFLSTVIVWITTWLIRKQDHYRYPVGRRRLEPLGVLVFSVIMITSFVQVALEAIQRLASPDHDIIQLGVPSIAIMLGTIVIKGMCWLWCRLVNNSSVQALAADASTDVIFNAGSIAFPIIGFYAGVWWLDALGGLVLSIIVIINWSQTSFEHIRHLSGFSATADQRNILLYLTMRFAKTIRQIQGLQAYHGGDKLTVEVDIVLDASTPLKDSHDLAESLQYVIESVPIVDRAFVHVDYATYNLPTHLAQQTS